MYSFKTLSWALTTLIPVTAVVSFAYGNWFCSANRTNALDPVITDTGPDCFDGRPVVSTPEAWWI